MGSRRLFLRESLIQLVLFALGVEPVFVGCPASSRESVIILILPRHPRMTLSLALIRALSAAVASAVKELTPTPAGAVPSSGTCSPFHQIAYAPEPTLEMSSM